MDPHTVLLCISIFCFLLVAGWLVLTHTKLKP